MQLQWPQLKDNDLSTMLDNSPKIGDEGLSGVEGVERGGELRNTSGSGIPMKHALGHGFMKGRRGFPEKGLCRFGVPLLEGGCKFFHHRLGAMPYGVVTSMTLLGLAGTFNG